MSISKRIYDRLIRLGYQRQRRKLQTTSPDAFLRASERGALSAFRRAANRVPAYREILASRGVEPGNVRSIEDFRQQVPVVDKSTLFPPHELRDLCVDGSLDSVANFYSSSGHTGTFSFGVSRRGDSDRTALGLEFLFDTYFRIFEHKTLLVSCMPMGVRIPTRTVPIAECGTRVDAGLAIMSKVTEDFDQFILAGEHMVLKRLVDEGPGHGIDWSRLKVHALSGAEYIPESFRSYLAASLGMDFCDEDGGRLFLNFGLSELGLNLFNESIETIRIRRLAQKDTHLLEALTGASASFCPEIMQYYPSRTFCEFLPREDGQTELVVTTLDPSARLPMIRYNTHDLVTSLSYETLLKALRETGHEESAPEYALPLGLIAGKRDGVRLRDGRFLYVPEVKEALYSDHEVARSITGRFHIIESEEGSPKVLIQFRQRAEPSRSTCGPIRSVLKDMTGHDIPVVPCAYAEFSKDNTEAYTRKHNYVAKP